MKKKWMLKKEARELLESKYRDLKFINYSVLDEDGSYYFCTNDDDEDDIPEEEDESPANWVCHPMADAEGDVYYAWFDFPQSCDWAWDKTEYDIKGLEPAHYNIKEDVESKGYDWKNVWDSASNAATAGMYNVVFYNSEDKDFDTYWMSSSEGCYTPEGSEIIYDRDCPVGIEELIMLAEGTYED